MIRYIDYIFGKLQGFLYTPFVLGDYFKFKRKNDGRFALRIKDLYPCVREKTAKISFDRHYVYHTAWAARKVEEINPKFHIDISSSISFSAILSAFVPVKFYDYRPAELNLSGLTSGKADLAALPFADGSIQSLSCMHVVEHVGLGRYGDKIDPTGDLKAIGELKRVLAPGGFLLFVVPMGRPKIQFNAHRIYGYDQIREYFNDLELKEFSLIPARAEDGGIIYDATKERADHESYGCGCFLFKKSG